MTLEYVQTMPTADTEAFTGFITVADWQGAFKYAIYYEDGEMVDSNTGGRIEGCTQTFYYDCVDVSVNGEVVYTSCTQTGVSIDCTLDWPELEPEDYDKNGSGGGENNDVRLCPHPELEGQYIACPDNMVICEEGFVANADGDCIRELCEAGTNFHPEFGCISEEDLWEEENIDDTELEPCMQNVLNDLKNLEQGVGRVIQQFDNSGPEFKWIVKSGQIEDDANASTSSRYNEGVTTTFSTQNLDHASDLSTARTILHEAVHAYVVSVQTVYGDTAIRNAMLGVDWFSVNLTINQDQGHPFIAQNYLNSIYGALKEYGESKGYQLEDKFYQDMAWGGLTHHKTGGVREEAPWFQELVTDPDERERILNVLAIESNGHNLQGDRKIQKGGDGGC